MAAADKVLLFAKPGGPTRGIHRKSTSLETQSPRAFSSRVNYNKGTLSPNVARTMLQALSQVRSDGKLQPAVDMMSKLFPAGTDKQQIHSAIQTFSKELSQIEGLRPQVTALVSEAKNKISQDLNIKDFTDWAVESFNQLKAEFPALNTALKNYAQNIASALGNDSLAAKALARLDKMGFGEGAVQLKQVMAIVKLLGLEQASLKQLLKAFAIK